MQKMTPPRKMAEPGYSMRATLASQSVALYPTVSTKMYRYLKHFFATGFLRSHSLEH